MCFVECVRKLCLFNANSLELWQIILCRNGQRYRYDRWDLEIEAMLRRARGNFQARVGRISFSVPAYRIWQERNRRIFQRKYRNDSNVLKRYRLLCSKLRCRGGND